MSARLAIGIGATTSARVDDLVALVRASLATVEPIEKRTSRDEHRELVIATVDRRIALAREIARVFACDVVTFDAPTLATVDGAGVRSERALATLGTASVAEAAAIAALRPSRARLVVARATGRRCTCAIAEAI